MPTRGEHTGLKASIELYEFEDGSCPAQDYLDELSVSDRQKVDNLFEMMGIKGEIRNDTKFKKLEGSDGIFEFKAFQIRLLCFYGKGPPKKLVISHGVTKKQDKHAKADIQRAEASRKKYFGE
ncbi:type II toxin-antitoxin system RelE/ParE family toxin [Xanthomonas sacchari]|uniref:type II toxin-antitoxin system RelE/ParE family toxin n=1 Tax=Xanthomonas sacchari TaxID=56458 RepID=UPI00224FB9EC|nr:type II toxin-antitoxin system RelE/ParE family toxin [Xanthomonas sacchari]